MNIDTLIPYGTLLAALATIITALIALYLSDWKTRINRPILVPYFSDKKEPPYFDMLAFEKYNIPISFIGQIIYLHKPGFNCRIKITNSGKSTAKNVTARVEKIFFTSKDDSSFRHYHPTDIKWSGQRDWQPVDIAPNSFYFLDVFWSKNEMPSVVLDFNNSWYKQEIQKDLLEYIINERIRPPGEVYWNVWIDTSFARGVPVKYADEGLFTIHIIINAENCHPLYLQARVNWKASKWDCPSITILRNNKTVGSDPEIKNESFTKNDM